MGEGWRGLRSGFERLVLVGVDGVEKCRRGYGVVLIAQTGQGHP